MRRAAGVGWAFLLLFRPDELRVYYFAKNILLKDIVFDYVIKTVTLSAVQDIVLLKNFPLFLVLNILEYLYQMVEGTNCGAFISQC